MSSLESTSNDHKIAYLPRCSSQPDT